MSKVLGEFAWSLFLSDRTKVEKEKENFVLAFFYTSSIKCKIMHFHVVVVQRRQRNAQEKCHARANLLFCLIRKVSLYMKVGTPDR